MMSCIDLASQLLSLAVQVVSGFIDELCLDPAHNACPCSPGCGGFSDSWTLP